MKARPARISVISVLGAACLWGTSGPAQVLARAGVSPAAVGAARLLLGGLALAAVALASGAVIAASLLGGALVLSPAFIYHASGLVSVHGLLLTAWLGLVSTALAYVLFVRGLRGVPASTAGTLSLAEPLVAVTIAVVLLGEKLAPISIAGGCLLLTGIAFASLPSLRPVATVDALAETAS